jgi:predicted GTPase
MLVIDAEQGITEQDKHVVGYAVELNKAVILVVNKWDLIPRSQTAMSDFTKKIRKEFKFLEYAPVIYVSAKDKSRIDTVFQALDTVYEAYGRRIQTSVLNDILQDAQIMNPAPLFEGGRLRIYFANRSMPDPRLLSCSSIVQNMRTSHIFATSKIAYANHFLLMERRSKSFSGSASKNANRHRWNRHMGHGISAGSDR